LILIGGCGKGVGIGGDKLDKIMCPVGDEKCVITEPWVVVVVASLLPGAYHDGVDPMLCQR
jgi:hypothetical protein